jgi:transcriptional regulator with XRE-family HTH domain
MIQLGAITNAVQRLRYHFGETQPKFAARLNIAVVTLARWETARPPRGKALAKLLALAQSEDLKDCAEIFQQALDGNIEPSGTAASELFLNHRERALAMALVAVLRNPEQYRELTKAVEPALRKLLDHYRANLEAEGVHVPMALAIVQLRNEGQSPEQIAGGLGMEIATVQQILMLDRFGLIPERRLVTRPAPGATELVRNTVEPRRGIRSEVKRVQAPARHPRASAYVTPRPVRKLSDVLESYLNEEESKS